MQNTLYQKISNTHCPPGYKLNEMIPFGWPFRRIRVKVTASKSPEKSIQHIYSIMLETIEAGWNTEEALSEFLGLQSEDFFF